MGPLQLGPGGERLGSGGLVRGGEPSITKCSEGAGCQALTTLDCSHFPNCHSSPLCHSSAFPMGGWVAFSAPVRNGSWGWVLSAGRRRALQLSGCGRLWSADVLLLLSDAVGLVLHISSALTGQRRTRTSFLIKQSSSQNCPGALEVLCFGKNVS